MMMKNSLLYFHKLSLKRKRRNLKITTLKTNTQTLLPKNLTNRNPTRTKIFHKPKIKPSSSSPTNSPLPSQNLMTRKIISILSKNLRNKNPKLNPKIDKFYVPNLPHLSANTFAHQITLHSQIKWLYNQIKKINFCLKTLSTHNILKLKAKKLKMSTVCTLLKSSKAFQIH